MDELKWFVTDVPQQCKVVWQIFDWRTFLIHSKLTFSNMSKTLNNGKCATYRLIKQYKSYYKRTKAKTDFSKIFMPKCAICLISRF